MSHAFRAKAIVLAVLTVFGIGGTVSTASAAYTNVVVRNTSTTAVPVKGTVSIGNRPSVYSRQSGTWAVELSKVATVAVDPAHNGVTVQNTPNVNVANTPNVNVANTPTVKIDPAGNQVALASSPESPVYFTQVPASDHTPSMICLGAVSAASGPQEWTKVLPDDGRYLVIETMNVDVDSRQTAQLLVEKDGVVIGRFNPAVKVSASGGAVYRDASGMEECRVVVPPGSTLRFKGSAPMAGYNTFLTLSGYLTAAP